MHDEFDELFELCIMYLHTIYYMGHIECLYHNYLSNLTSLLLSLDHAKDPLASSINYLVICVKLFNI
jgi:hypothetical protein